MGNRKTITNNLSRAIVMNVVYTKTQNREDVTSTVTAFI